MTVLIIVVIIDGIFDVGFASAGDSLLVFICKDVGTLDVVGSSCCEDEDVVAVSVCVEVVAISLLIGQEANSQCGEILVTSVPSLHV